MRGNHSAKNIFAEDEIFAKQFLFGGRRGRREFSGAQVDGLLEKNRKRLPSWQ